MILKIKTMDDLDDLIKQLENIRHEKNKLKER
jgi:hypothetical protein